LKQNKTSKVKSKLKALLETKKMKILPNKLRDVWELKGKIPKIQSLNVGILSKMKFERSMHV
jgi:hypothetical protein